MKGWGWRHQVSFVVLFLSCAALAALCDWPWYVGGTVTIAVTSPLYLLAWWEGRRHGREAP